MFRALAKQSAFCEDRLQKFSEPWRNIILTNGCFCLKQLWELEHPLQMTTIQLCEQAKIRVYSPVRFKDAMQYFFLALETTSTLSKEIDDLLSYIVFELEVRPTYYTEAVLLSKKVIKIDTSGVTDLDKFFNSLYDLLEILAENPNDPNANEEAEKLYRKCLQIYPNDCDIMCNIGSLLAKKPSGCEEAEKLYRKSLQIKPNDCYVMNRLGYLLLRKKPSGYKEAKTLFRKCIQINPNYWQALNNLGIVLCIKPTGYEEAEKLFRKCIHINPNCCPAMDNLGTLLSEKASGYEEAENLLQKCLEIQPTNENALKLLEKLKSLKK